MQTLARLYEMQNLLDALILATPTGELRNALTQVNIELMDVILKVQKGELK